MLANFTEEAHTKLHQIVIEKRNMTADDSDEPETLRIRLVLNTL